ncbi:MAG: VIT1/CCC1 transporter family protein [Acidobacteria bacterium]|nr:VIT1/CCC1 transporter family protein [Acidobacteriota bacterium]
MAGPTPEAPRSPRPSKHVAPEGLYETAQHYVGDLVYGANDGVLTTFAVVAGVTGGALPATAVVVVGMANLVADGLSMGVGNDLGIRARESALERQGRPEEESQPARHGVATFLAFAAAGFVPLFPYLVPGAGDEFTPAACLAFTTLFGVGAARSLVTASRWWVSGLEMLGLGILVAIAAYATGAGVARLIQNGAG